MYLRRQQTFCFHFSFAELIYPADHIHGNVSAYYAKNFYQCLLTVLSLERRHKAWECVSNHVSFAMSEIKRLHFQYKLLFVLNVMIYYIALHF